MCWLSSTFTLELFPFCSIPFCSVPFLPSKNNITEGFHFWSMSELLRQKDVPMNSENVDMFVE